MPTTKLITGPPDVWLQDLGMFMTEGDQAMGYRDPFFRRVAIPLLQAIRALREDPGGVAGLDKAAEALARSSSEELKAWAQEWRDLRKAMG